MRQIYLYELENPCEGFVHLSARSRCSSLQLSSQEFCYSTYIMLDASLPPSGDCELPQRRNCLAHFCIPNSKHSICSTVHIQEMNEWITVNGRFPIKARMNYPTIEQVWKQNGLRCDKFLLNWKYLKNRLKLTIADMVEDLWIREGVDLAECQH